MRQRLRLGPRTFVLLLALTGSLVAGIVLGAGDDAKQELITGEVVSLAGCLMKGHMGPDKAAVGAFDTGERGLPIGIFVAGQDRVYLAIYRGGNAAPKLAGLMGKTVNAQGPVYARHGVNLIDIQVVAEQ
jgi:hypothetical protein